MCSKLKDYLSVKLWVSDVGWSVKDSGLMETSVAVLALLKVVVVGLDNIDGDVWASVSKVELREGSPAPC